MNKRISERLLSEIYKEISFRLENEMRMKFSIYYRNKFYYIRENKEESEEYILNIYNENNQYLDNIYMGLKKEYRKEYKYLNI